MAGPAWADATFAFLDQVVADQGPFAGIMGYSQGAAIIPAYLAALGDAVRWEPSRGGQLFPHLYGPLTLDVVVAYGPLHRDDTGQVQRPITG